MKSKPKFSEKHCDEFDKNKSMTVIMLRDMLNKMIEDGRGDYSFDPKLEGLSVLHGKVEFRESLWGPFCDYRYDTEDYRNFGIDDDGSFVFDLNGR